MSPSSPTPACGLDWRVVPGQHPNSETDGLVGVAAVSPDDVWAVGSYNDANQSGRSLIEHWDGSSWSVVPSPNPGTDVTIPIGVAVVSANDVWIVGYYVRGGPWRTLTMHWDGATWSVVPSPNVRTNGSADLRSVSAVSSNDVWAVGEYVNSDGYSQALIEHWDGNQWSIVPRPDPVGLYNGIYGVTARSSDDAWAAGYFRNEGNDHTLTMHWDGSQWSIVPSPDAGDRADILFGSKAISANDVWVVGDHITKSPKEGARREPTFEHWDGDQWRVVPGQIGENSTDNFLYGVDANSDRDVWAVGYYLTNGIPGMSLIEHWDGNRWGIVPNPNPFNYVNILKSVAVVSANDVWAVGYGQSFGKPVRLLIEHYSDPCATPTPTMTPTPLATYTATPTFTPTPCDINFTDVWPADYFYEAVRYLYCHGVISGYSDGSFRPYDNATRGQLCKIIVLAEGWPIDTSGGPHFTDVLPGSTYYEYIETAYNHQVISGYGDGTFRWGNNVTRAQICKIVVLAENWPIDTTHGPHFIDVGESDPFYGYIETAYNRGIISGYSDGTFRPGDSARRGQICKIIYRVITMPNKS